jgi:phenylalanyl-tRNA synthetase beta chain
VIEAYGLPARTVAFELLVDVLEIALVHASPTGFGAALATGSVVKEDVALIVDDSVAASDVADALRDGCGPTLESLRLFDLYTGDQVQSGRKSLAFALKFRDPERTLTDEDVARLRAQGIAEAGRRCGAILRGA